MPAQHMYVTGKIMWAKGLGELDTEYDIYGAQLKVTGEVRDQVESAGCQMTFKKTDNDLYSFKIKSSSTKKVWDNDAKALVDVDGKPEVFVISPEGKKIDIDPKTVGNESDVTAKLELYDTSKGGKGTRLLGVRVDNLLEYTPGPTVIDNGVEPF